MLAACALLQRAASADDWTGLHSAIRNAGDLDGDGVCDILLARRFGTPNSVAALSGKNGALLWVARAQGPGAHFGCAMDAVGDVDGDGLGDVVIGAGYCFEATQENLARAARVRPRDRGLFRDTQSVGAYVLSGVDGSTLFALPGGPSVAGAGDVDGDRVPDVLVATPLEAEEVRVYSGRTGSLIQRVEAPLDLSGSYFGCAVTGMRDLDGDGCADFAACAPGSCDAAGNASATVSLYSGKTACELARIPLQWNSSTGMPWTLARLGDMDGDGTQDLGIGLLSRGVLVVSGRDLRTLARVDHSWGIIDSFGASMDRLDDVDADGYPDLVVGANERFPMFDSGLVDVYSGKTGALIRRPVNTRAAGADACAMGDVDGDGAPDVAYVFEPVFPYEDSATDGPRGLHVISCGTWMEIYRVDIDAIWLGDQTGAEFDELQRRDAPKDR